MTKDPARKASGITDPEKLTALADPMERIVAEALDAAGYAYVTDFGGGNPSGLDFRLPDEDVEIEVKRLHSPRIAEQMARAANVIAIQGAPAVEWFASLLKDNAVLRRELRSTTDALIECRARAKDTPDAA